MSYKLQYIKDIQGNNYIGVKFPLDVIEPYLQQLKDIVDDDEQYEILVGNQIKRDSREGQTHRHHATVIPAPNFNNLVKQLGKDVHDRLDILFGLHITDIEFKGVGKAERNGRVAYFIVLDSPTLDEVRSSLGLTPFDFHITLGFDPKDVFGVRKNQPIR